MLRTIAYCAVPVIGVICSIGCKPNLWIPKPPAPPSVAKDYNVWWNDLGPNGAPSNPYWSAQRQVDHPLPPVSCGNNQPYDSACTDVKVVKDKAAFPNAAICWTFNGFPPLPGHADWMVAEYSGAIGWLNYAADFDFNFMLFPDENAGITKKNHMALGIRKEGDEPEKTPFIEVEFDPRETVANFSTTWWTDLMAKAQDFTVSGDPPKMNQHNPDQLPLGVVFGLFCLDCEHGCRSEVHPVYGLAIQVDDRANDNTWAIFVRNWGDGGFCSRYDHQLNTDNNKVTVLLPRTGNQGPATVTPADYEFASTEKMDLPTMEFRPGQGVAVTFTLQQPTNHVQAELVLHLHWPDGSLPFPYPNVRYTDARRVQLSESLEAPDNAEAYLGKLLRDVNAAKPPLQKTALPATRVRRNQLLASQAKKEIPIPTNPNPAAPTPSKAKGRLRVEKPAEEGEQGLVSRVCAAYPPGQAPTDKIPELNKICGQLAKKK